MLDCKLYTKNYKQEYTFKFKGKDYRVRSVVRLTEKGRRYLGSRTREVILLEQFINWNGKTCWKYQFRSFNSYGEAADYSTDRTPDELIEEVVSEPTLSYVYREAMDVMLPIYQEKKQKPKGWDIPEVRRGWLVLIAIFVGTIFFKDVVGKLIVRVLAGVIFGLYRQSYIESYTSYGYDDKDKDIIQKQIEVLYGIKPDNKENNQIEK